MISNVASEPYTLIMGFHMNNVAWGIFHDSGLVYAPFIIMLVSNYIKARTAGEKEGPSGQVLLNYVEMDVYKMLAVLVMCVIPWGGTVNSGDTGFTTYTCSSRNLLDDNQIADMSLVGNISDRTPSTQPWWHITHEISSWITNSFIGNIPCAEDMRFAQVAYNDSKIEDPATQRFAQQFMSQCFNPAMQNIIKNNAGVDPHKDLWAGSDKAISFYNKETSGMTIDAGYWMQSTGSSEDLDPDRGPDAYPGCAKAYSHLSNKVYEEYAGLNADSRIKNGNKALFGKDEESNKKRYMKKVMAAAEIKPKSGAVGGRFLNKTPFDEITESNPSLNSSDGNFISSNAVDIGGTLKNFGASADAVAFRTMVPHVVTALQMLIIIVAPIVIILSGYKPVIVGTLTAWYFAAEFTIAIVELAYWFDNLVTSIVAYSDGAIGRESGLMHSIMRLLGNFSYQWFPIAWLTLSSLLGVRSIVTAVSPASNASAGTGGATISATRAAAGGVKGAAAKAGSSLARR